MKSRFVFICAAGHSGSTLLNMLLGAHTEGVAVGEITQLPKSIVLDSVCSCGQHLAGCQFWSPLITEFGDSIDIDLWRNPYSLNLGFIKAGREIDPNHQTRLRMMWRKITYGVEYAHILWRTPRPVFLHHAIQEGAEYKRTLFDFLLEYTDQQFVVDSSKHYLDGLSLYRAAPSETKVILLLRDGRAVFNSGLSRGLRPKAALHAWNRHSHRSSLVLNKELPDSALLTIKYEALATSPESELRRISKFLGIEYCSQMLDFAVLEQHVVTGNQMRFTQNTKIKLDERWREELSAPMLGFFDHHAGKLNRQLGYGD